MTSPPDEPTTIPFRIPRYDGFLPLLQPDPLLGRNRTLPALLLRQAELQSPPPGNVRRPSLTALQNPNMRYMRLIGNNNPRYRWEQYRKTPEELKGMKKPIRKYYERNNSLIDRYIYIDGLLDSTLPHDLLQTYNPPEMILGNPKRPPPRSGSGSSDPPQVAVHRMPTMKRRPSYLYKIADEESPLLGHEAGSGGWSAESQARIVKIAIYVNLLANALLLISKIMVAIMTSSLSVLASLVDAALDFLSTAIVWTTTTLIERRDKYLYPVGRSRLEPLGILVFSIIMITSFIQIGLEAIQRLASTDRSIVTLSPYAIAIMCSTIVIKSFCFLWCRMIRNSSVQALAQDALTDVIFNTFSILFPLLGTLTHQWYFDALGGLVLSVYVITSWASVSKEHIENLTGAAASPDERNVLLYLTMRFAKSIRQITSVQAYHAGDLLNVEVDIVLDHGLELKDSHDLGESLQYVLESLGVVDRAFVHLDYDSTNPPGHLR